MMIECNVCGKKIQDMGLSVCDSCANKIEEEMKNDDLYQEEGKQ